LPTWRIRNSKSNGIGFLSKPVGWFWKKLGTDTCVSVLFFVILWKENERTGTDRRNRYSRKGDKHGEKVSGIGSGRGIGNRGIYVTLLGDQLGIEVPRNGAGHRYYEEEQIVLFRNVKRLKEAGFGLRQIKAMGERMSAVAELSDEKLAELRERIARLEAEQETVFCKEAGTQEHIGHREGRTESGTLALCVEPKTAAVDLSAEAGAREEGMRLLQEGMTKWLGELLQKNNEQLSHKIEDGVSERMARELRFLFRQQEEREEERYRRLDRTIREYQQARAAGRQPGGRELSLFGRKPAQSVKRF